MIFFNLTEVLLNIFDIGTKKKGEKIDYVIKKSGEPILIIECKNGMKMLMLIILNRIDIIMFQNLVLCFNKWSYL
jgi:hypothetical protein